MIKGLVSSDSQKVPLSLKTVAFFFTPLSGGNQL